MAAMEFSSSAALSAGAAAVASSSGETVSVTVIFWVLPDTCPESRFASANPVGRVSLSVVDGEVAAVPKHARPFGYDDTSREVEKRLAESMSYFA